MKMPPPYGRALAAFVLPPFVIYALNWLTIRMYSALPWYDVPMHIVGGAAVAYGVHRALALFEKNKNVPRVPFAMRALLLVGVAATVGILWEMHELVLDAFHVFPFVTQPSVADTVADLSNDLFGASLTVIALRIWKRR